ncbi:MAG: PfkB family carbohydrate kinase, partial [Synechococcales bacterium]|nr:PfkB family carbohydrate kinase [Synechococcales bacterium]
INHSGVDHSVVPSHGADEAAVFSYLARLGIPAIAITHGDQPITYLEIPSQVARSPIVRSQQTVNPPIGASSLRSIAVPQVQTVDTLGAGDIFHGAFCWSILQVPFEQALQQASVIASRSCQQFGPRYVKKPT